MNSSYWDRKLVQRRRFLAAGGTTMLGAAGAVLVGCGGDDDSSQRESGSPTAAGSISTAAAPTTSAPTHQGGLFISGAGNAASDHLDVQQSVHPGILKFSQYANDGLMALDEPTPGDLTIKPMLIESWEQPDDQTVVLHVRRGVKFANIAPANGRAMTAADIAFSLRRMGTDNAKFPRRSWFAPVDQITTPDDYTVRITTKRPYAALMQLLAHPWTVAIDSATVAQDGDQLKHMVGTGPFIAKRVELSVQVDFERNPDYWDASKPHLDAFRFIAIPDNAAQLAAFRTGQLNLVMPNTDVLAKFRDENPGAREVICPSPGIGMAGFNIRRAPFSDPRVRRAIANAVDIPAWLDALAKGDGQQTGPMPAYYKPWALSKEKLLYTKPDLQKAKDLMKAAGLENGFKMGTITTSRVDYQGSAIQMQADLKQLNIDVDIKVQPTSTEYSNKIFVQRDFDGMNGQDFAPDDPDQLSLKFHSQSDQNWTGYSNPAVDALFDKQSQTIDYAQRRAIVDEIQATLMDEVAIMWTFVLNQHSFYTKTAGNMRRSPMNGNEDRYEARNLFFSA
jgi:peptide/nickel transport system substrate-binding protein